MTKPKSKYRIKYRSKDAHKHKKLSSYKILVPLLSLTAFCWLADYSLDQQMPSNAEMSAFIDLKLAEYEAGKAKHVKLRKPHQYTREQALYEVWSLTQEDVAKPIYLFGKDGGKI